MNTIKKIMIILGAATLILPFTTEIYGKTKTKQGGQIDPYTQIHRQDDVKDCINLCSGTYSLEECQKKCQKNPFQTFKSSWLSKALGKK